MRKFITLALPALEAMRERHDDPKNMVKGDYLTGRKELWDKLAEEQKEVDDEFTAWYAIDDGLGSSKEEYEVLLRLRSELGDLMLVSAMAIKSVEEKLASLQEKGASK